MLTTWEYAALIVAGIQKLEAWLQKTVSDSHSSVSVEKYESQALNSSICSLA